MSLKLTINCKNCPFWLAGVFTFFLYADTAFAEACERVPQCQKQTKGKIHFKALQTRGWAFYCTGEYPYYWNNDNILGFGNNFNRSPSCFSVVENPFAEISHPSKADFTITNWCHESKFPWIPKSDDVTVTIGCSKVSGNLPSCTGEYSDPMKDPKCPIKGKVSQYCSHGTVPTCLQVWTEQCSDGKDYYCTKDSVFPTYCIRCNE